MFRCHHDSQSVLDARICNHCTHPSCAEACPRKAIYKREEDGVVLAGGNSRRFGEANKAVAVADGVTLVQRVVEAVRTVSGDSPIVAVNRDEQRDSIEVGLESGTDPRFAFDAESFDGPVSGLYGALPAIDDD